MNSRFKKAANWSCQTPARCCQHLNFCFPCKRGLYWLTSLYWEASADSLNFFSAAPKLLVDFSQQVHNVHENSNCLYTCRSLTLPIHGLFKSLQLYLYWVWNSFWTQIGSQTHFVAYDAQSGVHEITEWLMALSKNFRRLHDNFFRA